MNAVAERSLIHENTQLNQYERTRADTETWVAEALNGSMRTTFEYQFDGVELYAEDGGALTTIFDDAIEAAQVITRYNPGLLFELRRRLHEREELDEMLRMARGELPNTMIVVSDYPPELMGATEDVGGYNSTRKQTMLRVITREADGSIRTVTQSLDGSNRQALEAIYGSLGEPVEAGELLGQRIHRDLPDAWQGQLVDNLKQTYDASLSDQYGGTWSAGFREPDTRSSIDTYTFARSQNDLIEWFTHAKLTDPHGAEKLRFKLAATMHSRYEQFLSGDIRSVEQTIGGYVVTSTHEARAMQWQMLHEIDQATDRAIASGQTFSGCGASVGPEGSAEDQLSQSGYGNKADDDCEFISKECPMCHAKDVKTKVTKKQISGSCGCVKKK